MKLNESNGIFFREKCPGVSCRFNNRCVRALDGIVDCLEGEDEQNRISFTSSNSFLKYFSILLFQFFNG